jgi:hypothetical protein
VRPKGYVDPKTDDNTYVVSFTIAATTQPSMFTELLAIPVILLLLILILRRRKS